MNFYSHPNYEEFEKFVLSSFKNKSNSLIISVPGMSVTFYIQKFIKKNGKEFNYISEDGQKVEENNFIDLDFSLNKKALEVVDGYLKKAKSNQKFIIVLDTPYLLHSDKFASSYLSNHFYKLFYFKILDQDLIKIFSSNINVRLGRNEIKEVFNLSGGISAIAKLLLANEELLDVKQKDLVADDKFLKTILPTLKVIKRCSVGDLEKLGIMQDGKFISLLLNKYFEINNLEIIDIEIKKNLIFSEDGVMNKNSLLRLEKKIIEAAIQSDRTIPKEEIADIKWGKNSYDDYSDEAITKTILRLNKKLQKYKFVSIPTYGYFLTKLKK